jgi:hypothetical protein
MVSGSRPLDMTTDLAESWTVETIERAAALVADLGQVHRLWFVAALLVGHLHGQWREHQVRIDADPFIRWPDRDV